MEGISSLCSLQMLFFSLQPSVTPKHLVRNRNTIINKEIDTCVDLTG